MYRVSIEFYIITQVILTLWLVLAYDLLDYRRTIGIIIKSFSLCVLKMEKRFENLDHILRDLAKEKIQKKSCWCIEQVLGARS